MKCTKFKDFARQILTLAPPGCHMPAQSDQTLEFGYEAPPPPRDHLNNSVVHLRDQRNMKKGLCFEAELDLRESRLGVEMCVFMRKRVLLDSIKGCLGSFFKLHQTCPQKKG